MSAALPEDLARASGGDLDALRRLRAHSQGIASGRITEPHLTPTEAAVQSVLLAEMIASVSEEAEDLAALLLAHHLRGQALRRDPAARKEGRRLAYHSARFREVLGRIVRHASPEPAAFLLAVFSHQADSGNENGALGLQRLMRAIAPERVPAIQAAARKFEECPA